MKHPTAAALNRLEPLLEKIRAVPGLKEKSRGVFYYKSKPFLHFHEDPAGLFADVMQGGAAGRLAVNTEGEQVVLLSAIKRTIE